MYSQKKDPLYSVQWKFNFKIKSVQISVSEKINKLVSCKSKTKLVKQSGNPLLDAPNPLVMSFPWIKVVGLAWTFRDFKDKTEKVSQWEEEIVKDQISIAFKKKSLLNLHNLTEETCFFLQCSGSAGKWERILQIVPTTLFIWYETRSLLMWTLSMLRRKVGSKDE